MKENITELYFTRLTKKISDRQHPAKQYSKLLRELFSIDYFYSVELDGNRYEDGIALRYHFGEERNIPGAVISSCLDTFPCSVLEMMISLAEKCENEVLYDPEQGSYDSLLFWEMIENLGLDGQTDDRFDKAYVHERTGIFLERRYKRNGEGGLFVIPDCPHDMRTAEVWYQAMWYLNAKYRNRRI